MILKLSDAAAPWWIEIWCDSSCFGVGYASAPFTAWRFDGTIAIAVPLDLIPALLSAIEELLAHPGLNAVNPVPGQSWSVRREGDEGILTGPGSVHMIDAGNAECGLARIIEVAHGHLPHLRRAVADLVLLGAGTFENPAIARRRGDRARTSQDRSRGYPP
jgi:hypothetical protein